MPHKKQNNNKNTKRKIGGKLKRNRTYKKLKKGGFWLFKNKDANGNVIEEPKSSNFFSNLFKFTKSDPAEAIAKLETEKQKCITDIDTKISKLKTQESTEVNNPMMEAKPEEKKEEATLSPEPIKQTTLSMEPQPQPQMQPQQQQMQPQQQPQQQQMQPQQQPQMQARAQGGIVKKSKKRRYHNYAY